jgi:hypothetical protein
MMISSKLHIFDSPAEFLGECDRLHIRGEFSSWTGGLDREQVRKALIHGDARYVPEAEAAIKDVTDDIRFETLRPEWESSIAGAIPDVPAFIVGLPKAMRRKVTHTTEQAPIKLFVNLASSGGIPVEKLKQRGICLLALVIALTQVRAVEMFIFDAEEKFAYMVKMPTAPLDVGLASFLLVDQSFTRGLGYHYAEHFMRGFMHMPPLNNLERCRALVGAEGPDVVFPPIQWNENFNEPTKWVKDRLHTILDLSREITDALV